MVTNIFSQIELSIYQFNSLPDDIADAKSINSFKNKIDSHFRDIMFDFLG